MTASAAIALIPAHNEADLLATTVAATLALPEVEHVLVIDDGSTDDTASVAESAGAEVIRTTRNKGKGAALNLGVDELARRGLITFSSTEQPVILLLDADLGETASCATSLLSLVLSGEADMTIGRFPPPTSKAGFGFVKRLAHTAIAEQGGGFDTQAPLSGQRCLNAVCLVACLPFAAGYGVEVALTIRALQAGLSVVEVPVEMSHRATGRDLPGFLHRFRQYRDIRRTLREL